MSATVHPGSVDAAYQRDPGRPLTAADDVAAGVAQNGQPIRNMVGERSPSEIERGPVERKFGLQRRGHGNWAAGRVAFAACTSTAATSHPPTSKQPTTVTTPTSPRPDRQRTE